MDDMMKMDEEIVRQHEDLFKQLSEDKKGKYGRYVAKLWIEDICVNDHLVESGHAEYRKY